MSRRGIRTLSSCPCLIEEEAVFFVSCPVMRTFELCVCMGLHKAVTLPSEMLRLPPTVHWGFFVFLLAYVDRHMVKLMRRGYGLRYGSRRSPVLKEAC